ncbi:MAG TPA: PHB depolymerase family esterase [Syntrophales bacterium]|nr:PHB depolymerase family esterase [Syntrophales bacterium]
MQRIIAAVRAIRAPLLAVACILLLVWPTFAKDSPGKDTALSLRHGGRTRTYLVHLPVSYSKDKAWPVVLIFHGGGGSGEQMAKMTGFSEKADREGFIAVYPNGTGLWQNRFLTWNAGNCCAWAYENRIDDVGFIRALIGKLKSDYAVDDRRIYATGISNGGMMSYRLACELSDLIAAIGPVAGAQNLDCKPLRPVSVIVLHGTADLYVRYGGGTPLRMVDVRNPRVDRPVSQAVAFWVKQDGCAEKPAREKKGSVLVDRYSGCSAGTAVTLYTLQDEGHTWPGGTKWAFWADEPSREVSATDVIWEFFKNLPAGR